MQCAPEEAFPCFIASSGARCIRCRAYLLRSLDLLVGRLNLEEHRPETVVAAADGDARLAHPVVEEEMRGPLASANTY